MLTVLKIAMIAQIIVILFTLIFTMSIIFIDGSPFIKSSAIPSWTKIIATIVLIATVLIAVRKETYLPFLGPTAIPSVAIRDEFAPEHANVVLTIDLKDKAKDGDKVLYWAANEPNDATSDKKKNSDAVQNPWKAYKGFHNCGVAVVRDGSAVLKLNCPAKYKVAGRTLDKHVHYRIIPTTGVKLLGEVHTTFIDCN